MHFKRKLLALCLILVFSLQFVACGTNKNMPAGNEEDIVAENSNININEKYKFIGIAIYQNTPYNDYFYEFNSNDSYKNEVLNSINNNSVLGSEFLSIVYFYDSNSLSNQSYISENIVYFITKHENILQFDIEVIFETTDVLAYVIYIDNNNNYIFKLVGTSKFTENSENINFEFSTPILKEDINQIKIRLCKDLSTNLTY